MRIGINILYLIPKTVGGTETYARELIGAMLLNLKPTDRLIIFCSLETSGLFKDTKQLKIVSLPIHSSNRLSRVFAEQVLLPIYCLRYGVDILLSLGYSQPFILPCKSILTIHDLNWHYHFEDFSQISLFVWKNMTKISASCADAIISISKSTRKSLINVLAIDSHKIKVIYHGMSASKANLSKQKAVRQKYSLTSPYLLTVLSHYSHKNLETLVKAFQLVSQEVKNLHLFIAGTGNPEARKSRREYLRKIGHKNIHLLPYIPSEDLSIIYSLADIFVFPSAYEGFGLPVLEAMTHNTPVISSNAFALAEVVGSGGILVEPYDVNQYTKQIKLLLKNAKLRNKYLKLGQEQVRKFTWDKCAKQTLALTRKIYEEK